MFENQPFENFFWTIIIWIVVIKIGIFKSIIGLLKASFWGSFRTWLQMLIFEKCAKQFIRFLIYYYTCELYYFKIIKT